MNNSFENPVFGLMAGGFYLFCLGLVFLIIHRRSKFSFVLLYSEYFYAIGIGFGSIFLALDLLSINGFYGAYLQNNGLISSWTFVHIFSYSIGILFGIASWKKTSKFNFNLFSLEIDSNSQVFIYRALILLGLFFLFLYIIFVGPFLAFTTASKARAGFSTELDDFSKYVFLKNAAQIGTIGMIFFPYIISKNKIKFDIFLLVFYGAMLYILTGARAAIFDTVFLAALIYLSRNKINLKALFLISFAMVFAVIFTFYGKGIGDQLFYFLLEGGSDIELARDISFSDFMAQFVHLVYSIDSGVKSFFQNGPYISEAILLSPFGFMPNWMFSYFGLDFLNWKNVGIQDDIVCYNSISYPLAADCTVPPYFLGAAGYIGPVLFGFVFGWFRFYLIGKISMYWHECKFKPAMLWKGLLIYLVLARLTLFIPNVIGMFSFFGIVFVMVVMLSRLLKRIW